MVPTARPGAWRAYFRAYLPTSPVLLADFKRRQQLYPAGAGSAAILLSMPANSRRVRWLSASSSQQYRPCWTRRPPVFTNRCCRLVSDQLPIALGSANRRHRARPERSRRVAEVIRDHAKPQPHLVSALAMAAQPRHLHRLLAFLDPLLGRAALVVEAHHRPACGGKNWLR